MTFLEHFGFIEQPFGVTPDPRFLHLGPQHREALASLVCATEENRGFLALIGPPGMGKTTLLFQYLESMRHKARTAFLFQMACSTTDLMRYLLADIGIATSARELPELNALLNGVLTEEMRAGRRFVLVIDEAQNLSPQVLESVRLLSNFETPWMKLMQIVLAGQPQLAEHLARPSMAQLRQRISSFIRLEPFGPEETNAYINHRLWVAGHAEANLFTVGARTAIAEHSGGIPRNINNLCYQSLMLAHAAGKEQVKAEMVREVISDLAIESLVPNARDGTHLQSVAPGRPSVAIEPVKVAQVLRPLSLPSSHRGKTRAAIVSICAVLFLSIVSGVLWRANSHTKPVGVTPSAEAAALPARSTALAPAPETVSPIQDTSPITNETQFGGPLVERTTAEKARGDHVFTVVVARGTTLRHISLRYLGQYDTADLAAILSLNPKITDPDDIQAGQEVRLPLSLLRDSAVERERCRRDFAGGFGRGGAMSRNFDILLREMPDPGRASSTATPNVHDAGTSRPRDRIALIDSEINKLVRQVFALHDDQRAAKAVIFCGINRGDGCSWVCARASEALAEQTPGRVCIVDANLRWPSLHEHFRVEKGAGLADAMKNATPIGTFARQAWSSHLWFVSAGSNDGDPNGALKAASLRARLSQLRAEFDYVLVDAPPIGSCGDGTLLGQLTDGVVLVVGCNSTRRETARAAKEGLEAAGVPILGTVLNKRTYPIPEALYRRL